MALIHGSSPVFKAPRRGWEIVELGVRRTCPGGGNLDLRIGYCRGPEAKTLAEQLETLRRRERAGDPVATRGDLRFSLVPVVLVDGEPVAAGWGRIDLPLPAGRHLVEVQSQHSRAWRAVDIEAGRTAKLDYVGMLGERHRDYATGQVRGAAADFTGYTLGPRGRLRFWQYLPSNARSRRSFVAVLLTAVASAILTWTAASFGVPEEIAIPAGAALWVIALAAWGVRILWTYVRYNRLRAEPPLDTKPFAPPGALAPQIIDPDGEPQTPGPGAAAVLVEARFIKADLESGELTLQLPSGQARIDRRQRRSLDTVGEVRPIRHRSAVPPPMIELDGVRVAASWTRMWIEMSPGRHRIEARTPEAPMPVPAGPAPPATASIAIDVPEGETLALDLLVSVKAVPDPTEPMLHEWTCRIETFGPATEPGPSRAPKADVRGALRRSATGRWWDRP